MNEDPKRRLFTEFGSALGEGAAAAAHRERLKTDLPYFSEQLLRILTKAGAVVPLAFNSAQLGLHEALECQKRETGKVRMLVGKGRQVGVSTMTAGRFYHRAITVPGTQVFILAHEDAASANLYRMVERFHADMDPGMRLEVSTQNVKEMIFSSNGSGYKVASARTVGTGRSATITCLHGSEVAFWSHGDDHAAGVMQAVAPVDGTEIVLESTGNGPQGLFFGMWQDAEAGKGLYRTHFISWTMMPEYYIDPRDYELTAEEKECGQLWKLSPGQLIWRRQKISELRDSLRFMAEYPMSAAEMWAMSGGNGFIPAPTVVQARKGKVGPSGPLVVGVDPAGAGGDRIAFAYRRGRRCEKIDTRTGLDTTGIVGEICRIARDERPARIFIDATGLGQGVFDHAKQALGDRVTAVHAAGKPFAPPPVDEQNRPTGGPLNRRAECWAEMKKWLQDEGGVSIPDRDDIQADLVGLNHSYDSSGRLKLESKIDLRKRGLRSPDLADALALTFSEPVAGPLFSSTSKLDIVSRASGQDFGYINVNRGPRTDKVFCDGPLGSADGWGDGVEGASAEVSESGHLLKVVVNWNNCSGRVAIGPGDDVIDLARQLKREIDGRYNDIIRQNRRGHYVGPIKYPPIGLY
jgi:hypothetical protein